MKENENLEILNKIFRDSSTLYGLKEFSDIPIKQIINLIKRDNRYFIKCLKRDKEIQIFNTENNSGSPEEIVRQLWL